MGRDKSEVGSSVNRGVNGGDDETAGTLANGRVSQKTTLTVLVEGSNTRRNPNTRQREAINIIRATPLMEWDPTKFIFRSSWSVPWVAIEERLTKELQRRVSLKPEGEERALLFCTTEQERGRISVKVVAIGRDLFEKAISWRPELHWEEPQWGESTAGLHSLVFH
ncbi:hypothetical protein Scep_001724 [Stephania cephalantha]|uniref:Uncharacterized protein n=1 Tax=Stephania cephalantha TaxID=152367 RepID=A0AAP0L9W3_9MAGN